MISLKRKQNTVTDELAPRSSLQEREQEPKKIKLLERDKEPSLRRSMKRKTYSWHKFDSEIVKKEALSYQRCLKRALNEWRRTNSRLCYIWSWDRRKLGTLQRSLWCLQHQPNQKKQRSPLYICLWRKSQQSQLYILDSSSSITATLYYGWWIKRIQLRDFRLSFFFMARDCISTINDNFENTLVSIM